MAKQRQENKIRATNGATIAPKLATANEKDLNSSIVEMPDRGPMKNDLSIYDENRSLLVPTLMRQRETPMQQANDFNFPLYATKQQEELEYTKLQMKQQQAEYSRLTSNLQQQDKDYASRIQTLNSSVQAAYADVNKERQEKLQYLLEVDRLKKENEMLRYQNSRLEMEKGTLNKALGDIKKQRDQAGMQRMQFVAIRNFLLALELERIRLMYLEKEQECELARVNCGLTKANLAAKENQLKAASVVSLTQQSTVRIIEKPVIDEKSLIAHFLVSLEVLRLSRPTSIRSSFQRVRKRKRRSEAVFERYEDLG